MEKIKYKIKSIMPDKMYLQIMYFRKFHKKLQLKNPQTFNEKLQWLKLYNRKPEYTKMVDKYEVRKYIKETIGEEYLIPLLGVYERVEDIDFENLPQQFVIKCTHDSGSVIICKNKEQLDIEETKKQMSKCLQTSYFVKGREWPYKNIQPRIVIEKYMTDDNGKGLNDYKFYCFNGVIKIISISSDRFQELKRTFFDENWNLLDLRIDEYGIDKELTKPMQAEKLKELSEKLSKDIPFVRVDWYEQNGKIYFGELTFFTDSGFGRYTPTEYDKILGDMLELPKGKRKKYEK